MQQTHAVRRPTGTPGMSIGMNWLVRQVNGHEIVWHNGGTGGYRAWIGFDKTRKVAAIVLTNSALGNDDLGFELVAGPGTSNSKFQRTHFEVWSLRFEV